MYGNNSNYFESSTIIFYNNQQSIIFYNNIFYNKIYIFIKNLLKFIKLFSFLFPV